MAKKIYGIAGHPVSHSLSPAMQMSAFRALGIDAEYRLFDIEEERLEGFLADMALNNIAGLNVTIPHKIKAKEYLEKNGTLDENAKRLGAVNTIKMTEEGPMGFNTDGPGFYRSLVKDLKFEPEGKVITILGSGGAATAVVMYLGNGPKKVYLFDIDEKKVSDLKAHYAGYYDSHRLITVQTDGLKEAVSSSSLIVNATPMGMKKTDPMPIDAGLLRPGMYIYDLVYNQPMTTLVKEAKRLKGHAVTGIGMLLYQGAIAFEIWTGQKAPVDIMKKALREALKI